MPFLRLISDSNNMGVEILNHGNSEQAFAHFVRALRYCNIEVPESDPVWTERDRRIRSIPPSMHHDLFNLHSQTNMNMRMSHHIPTSSGQQGSELMVASENERNCLLHKKGIPLPVDQSGTVDELLSDSLECDKLSLAVVIFNLGVSLHLPGMQKYKSSYASSAYRLLNKAKSLYEKSYALVIDILGTKSGVYTPQNTAPGNAMIDLLYMALLNNRAQLLQCELFRDYESSTFLYHHLVHYVQSILSWDNSYYNCMEVTMSMKQHMHYFLANASLTISSQIQSAASAA